MEEIYPAGRLPPALYGEPAARDKLNSA